MAIDQRLEEARKPGYGIGLLKGMRVLLKHLFKRNTVIEYPDVKQDLPSRTRGVIALKEENCTVCMLCARECPDWCIYIDSHKETLPAKRKGGRPRKRNVLDRFAIDYALCMYCGICVDVCPYDALFWSREFEYAEYDIRQLTHEKERLSDWMATVLPPPELERGAELPGRADKVPATAAAKAPAPSPTQPATGARPASQTSSAVEARPQQAASAPTTGTAAPTDARPATSAPDAKTGPVPETAKPTEGIEQETRAEQMDTGAAPTAEPAKKIEPAGEVAKEAPQREVEAGAQEAPPAEAERPAPAPAARPAPTEPTEDPNRAYERVLRDQLDAGSSPQVAEARAKVARVKAQRGIARPPQPTPPAPPTRTPEPSSTSEGPAGGPDAKPDRGTEAGSAGEPASSAVTEPTTEPEPHDAAPAADEGTASGEDPDAVYDRVLGEERAKGSSDAVATARAKAARMRARKGTRGPG